MHAYPQKDICNWRQHHTNYNILLLSTFQISYDEQSEVLLSYNSTSHIQKMECDAPETHKIAWNSVPVCKVVCAFPYILAFTPVTIEFRYAVNGSLLQTLAMPELRLISAKVCTYLKVHIQDL